VPRNKKTGLLKIGEESFYRLRANLICSASREWRTSISDPDYPIAESASYQRRGIRLVEWYGDASLSMEVGVWPL